MTGPDDYTPFNSDEAGWSNGCRPEDLEWVDRYGNLDFPETISNPIDALPPGFPAYTAVLHRLEHPDSHQQVKWIIDPGTDPWEQVQHILDDGIGDWPAAADTPLAQPEGGVLADVLDIGNEDSPLTVTYFFPPWTGTIPGELIATRLRNADHDLGHIPTFWFPHTRAWAASNPVRRGLDLPSQHHRDRATTARRPSYRGAGMHLPRTVTPTTQPRPYRKRSPDMPHSSWTSSW